MSKRNTKRGVTILLAVAAACSLLLTSCDKGAQKVANSGSAKEVKLTWYIVGSEQRDLDLVNDRVNEITKEKINATVDLNLLDWSSYNQRMNMIISAGEEFDLCWTAPQFNDYYANIARGAFLPLDDLLEKYGKATRSAAKEKFWNAARVDGKIYGALNYQIMATAYGYAVQREIADKAGVYYGDIKSYKELEPYLAYIKKNYPSMIPLGTIQKRDFFTSVLPMYGFDALGNTKIPGVVRYNDDKFTVINQYDTPEFRELIKTMSDWYKKGYIKADAATSEESEADFAADKVGVLFPAFTLDDTTEIDLRPDNGYYSSKKPYYIKKFSQPIISTDRAVATMTAISSTSKNPERAMMLIELVNTDEELYNTLCYGIEGKHYNKVDYTNEYGAHVQVERNKEGGYNPDSNWMFGNVSHAWLTPIDQPHSEWEKYNENSVISPTLGFAFNTDSVANDIAMSSAVVEEYLLSLVYGSSDIETRYQQFINKLKSAGADKIIAEKQKQLDAWRSLQNN